MYVNSWFPYIPDAFLTCSRTRRMLGRKSASRTCLAGCKCSWSRRRSEAISSSQRWDSKIIWPYHTRPLINHACKEYEQLLNYVYDAEYKLSSDQEQMKSFYLWYVTSCALAGIVAAAGWMGGRREHRRSCLQGGLRGSRRQGHYQRGWTYSWRGNVSRFIY